jgi:hypothetical protein
VPPAFAVFSDTGSERPETYVFVELFGKWLAERGVPLHVVRWIRVKGERAGTFLALHDWCEVYKTVPSRAFGMSGCTSKWKQQPADKFIKQHPEVVVVHAAGEVVERWIGFDADEPGRAAGMLAKNPDAHLWRWRAPLVEWNMGRDECVEVIRQAGLPLPGKSACWMCPSTTKPEIDLLQIQHPALLKRAVDMEAAAIASGGLASRAGLGGRLNWGDYLKTKQGAAPDEAPCGCYDGGD